MLLRLNPDITFSWNSNNDHRSVGVYLSRQDKAFQEQGIDRPIFLFGIPRDWLPDDKDQVAPDGAIIRRSWKTAVRMLYDLGQVRNKGYYRTITKGWRKHALV